MATRITRLTVRDVRFPTSLAFDGSDAMNPDPDYSAAYVVLETDRADGIEGHGLTFTIGRGTELCAAAARLVGAWIEGETLESLTADMAGFWRRITGDSQLRWLGPDKGVVHLATAAVINAVWDLWAKAENKPLWKLLADLSPRELVACIDFRYLTDALSPGQAIDRLEAKASGKAGRQRELLESGYPAYTTSAGWLGYDDDKLRRLCDEAVGRGFTRVKIKVGRDLEDDRRRCRIVRERIGDRRRLMLDANQVWEVGEAIEWTRRLAEFGPTWIEEPTSPDDLLGHAEIARALAPMGIGVATGEMCQNRVMFKQFMQAGAMQFCQLDACRLGGINEALAVCLLADRFGVPICPHAGGVGLCEYAQHLAMWDYVACSASLDSRVIEYVDHLHEHFLDPVRVEAGRYLAPMKAGASIEMKAASLERFTRAG